MLDNGKCQTKENQTSDYFYVIDAVFLLGSATFLQYFTLLTIAHAEIDTFMCMFLFCIIILFAGNLISIFRKTLSIAKDTCTFEQTMQLVGWLF